jgi:hypothetical protein
MSLFVGVTSIKLTTSRKSSFLGAAELCLLNVISPACDEDFDHLYDAAGRVVHKKEELSDTRKQNPLYSKLL